MLALTPPLTYYLYGPRTAMSKGFRGLCALGRNGIRRDPLDGNVCICINRRRDESELLVWDRTGFVLFYKSLEAGTFEFPHTPNCSISWNKLCMILEGISLDSVRQRKRYYRE